MSVDLATSLSLATPELILAVGAMVLLMIGVFSGENSNTRVTGLAVAVIIGAGAWLVLITGEGEAFGGAFVNDAFARFMKVLTLVGSVVALIMSVGFAKAEKFDRFEFPVLIVLATLGMMLMISANDMIALYMGLELQSLALYVVAAINRDNVRSTEAGLKYFVLGALSSGMLLYGISLVYGFTGHTGFPAIAEALSGADRPLGFLFGLVFVLAGLAFKISAVPFHMWTPDVYEGAPTPVTAFFASAPKMAAMALIVRVTIDAFAPVTSDWQQIVVFIAIASMALGAFAAIGQKNIKRLMAYSSIAHMGFALVGLAAGTMSGVHGVIIYMLIYLVMTLGTFAFILAMRRNDGNVEQISDLAGLSSTNPVMATVLTVLMFSLAGIPPLAGFWAKWYVFLAAVEANLWPLAIIGVLTSVVGAFYYLRIIKIMWFDEPVGGFVPMAGELRLVLGVSGAFVLLYVLVGGPVEAMAEAAARTFFLMEFRLSPTAIDAGYRLDAHDTVGSTNALALEHAAAGDPGRLWVAARRQTSGRGRRGRDWATPHGNLAASLLIVSGGDLAPLATLGFVAGLALADALDAVAPGLPVSVGIDGGGGAGSRYELKWPNDVLANGAKLSGILLESTRLESGGYGIAIGIGVNVVAHPSDTPYPATSLGELGASCSAEELFFALSDAWTGHFRVWNDGSGLARIRDRWLRRAAGLGSEIAVRHEGSVMRGIFETIDAECRIVVRDEGGHAHHIAAGDVHFGAVATVRE